MALLAPPSPLFVATVCLGSFFLEADRGERVPGRRPPTGMVDAIAASGGPPIRWVLHARDDVMGVDRRRDNSQWTRERGRRSAGGLQQSSR